MRRPLPFEPVLVIAVLATVSLASGGPSAPTKAPAAAPKPTAPKPVAAPKPVPPKAPASAPKLASLSGGWAPPAYVAMVKKWHSPAGKPPVDGAGRPKLVLSSINGMGRVELTPMSDRGGFSALDLDRASHLLRSSDGAEHPIDARLLDVAYALQRHFGAGEVRFLSGYRNPKRLGSNHGYGRAIDLVVPGATDDEVATYARSVGFVGVGIYPTSGFVHLDVRDRSFFWVDRSGPGKPNKTVGILGGDAAAADLVAKKAGHSGLHAPLIGRDVEAALAAHAKAISAASVAPPPSVSAASDETVDPYDDDH